MRLRSIIMYQHEYVISLRSIILDLFSKYCDLQRHMFILLNSRVISYIGITSSQNYNSLCSYSINILFIDLLFLKFNFKALFNNVSRFTQLKCMALCVISVCDIV